jgi:hypothetical protein
MVKTTKKLATILVAVLALGFLFKVQNNTDQKINYLLYSIDHGLKNVHRPFCYAGGELEPLGSRRLDYERDQGRYFIVWSGTGRDWSIRSDFDLSNVESGSLVTVSMNPQRILIFIERD